MPKNKNAEKRYKILDRLLASRYLNLTTEDLRQRVNEELEELDQSVVSLRTIQSDLKVLQEAPFSADIEQYQFPCVSQKNPNKTVTKICYRYRDRTFSIYQQKMSDDEKQLLGEAMTLLGQFDGLPNLERLESLRASLDIKSGRQIISFTKNPLENNNLLGELFTYISQRVVVKLHYHTFADIDNVKQIVLHPYLLKEYNRRWYLIAAADSNNKLLSFVLDRIDHVEALPSIKYRPYKGDPAERFEDIIGVTLYDDRPLQLITFWVSDHSKNYVLTKPLHDSQHHLRGERDAEMRRCYPTLTGGSFFTIECIENYELIRELCSFGADLLVLSPEDIKQKVYNHAAEQCKAYQDRLGIVEI